MAIDAGDRFVRRHNAARGSTSNTTAADITYDTAVLDDSGYTWSSPEVTVDTAGLYLYIADLGQVDVASTRAVGTHVPAVNTVNQNPLGIASHRYLRNSGGAEGASIGMAILDLAASDDVKVRNPGSGGIGQIDILGNYATRASYGGGIQLIRMPDGNLTHLERDNVNSADPGVSNINTTRPWIDSSGTWGKLTWGAEVQDDDNLAADLNGNITLKANKKYLIVWTAVHYSTDASRHAYVTALNIAGTRVQTASSYQRNTASQGPPMCGMYLHEVGGTNETAFLEATQESEGADAGTPQFRHGAIQVLELPDSAEWIHVDNGTTDSLTTALAGTGTYYDTPLSSTLRADGDSNLSLDGANNAVQNDSGGALPVLAIGWHRWDRDSGASGTRKMPWNRWNNGGSALGYGIAGAYSRGQQSGDDTFQAHYVGAATMDLANAADLKFQANEPASGANADMGVYASTSRYFLGVQVLNLETLVAGGSDATGVMAKQDYSETLYSQTVSADGNTTLSKQDYTQNIYSFSVIEGQGVSPTINKIAFTESLFPVSATGGALTTLSKLSYLEALYGLTVIGEATTTLNKQSYSQGIYSLAITGDSTALLNKLGYSLNQYPIAAQTGGSVIVALNKQDFSMTLYPATISGAAEIVLNRQQYNLSTYQLDALISTVAALNKLSYSEALYNISVQAGGSVAVVMGKQGFGLSIYPIETVLDITIGLNKQVFSQSVFSLSVVGDANAMLSKQEFVVNTYPILASIPAVAALNKIGFAVNQHSFSVIEGLGVAFTLNKQDYLITQHPLNTATGTTVNIGASYGMNIYPISIVGDSLVTLNKQGYVLSVYGVTIEAEDVGIPAAIERRVTLKSFVNIREDLKTPITAQVDLKSRITSQVVIHSCITPNVAL